MGGLVVMLRVNVCESLEVAGNSAGGGGGGGGEGSGVGAVMAVWVEAGGVEVATAMVSGCGAPKVGVEDCVVP